MIPTILTWQSTLELRKANWRHQSKFDTQFITNDPRVHTHSAEAIYRASTLDMLYWRVFRPKQGNAYQDTLQYYYNDASMSRDEIKTQCQSQSKMEHDAFRRDNNLPEPYMTPSIQFLDPERP